MTINDDQVFDKLVDKTEELNLNTIDEIQPLEFNPDNISIGDFEDFAPELFEGLHPDNQGIKSYVNAWGNVEGNLSDSKNLSFAIREKNKYNYFGKEHYHRPFDEKAEAEIKSGTSKRSREEMELGRLNKDLYERNNPENLSERDHMWAWFGEGPLEWRNEVDALKKVDREEWKKQNKELKEYVRANEPVKRLRWGFSESDPQGRVLRGSFWGANLEDVYNIYKDKYSSLEEYDNSQDSYGTEFEAW